MKPSQKINNEANKFAELNKPIFLKLPFFLSLNFAGLFLGGLFTSQAVTAEWYTSLNKSPVTPPGWFFGFAWTTIMVCFAFYMTSAHNSVANKNKLLTLYGLQWILNFLWNPLFFYLHQVSFALINITSLAVLITFIMLTYHNKMAWKSVLIVPYFLWICVATYLNLYILLNN